MDILSIWQKAQKIPGGNKAFSLFISKFAPYTGSIHPQILELEPGRVKVLMKDRRKLRNHLSSIHAMALANLGELSSGLAMITTLSKTQRAILVGFSVEYLKKARGNLVGSSLAKIPNVTGNERVAITWEITDASKDVVARGEATWLIGIKNTDSKSDTSK